MLLALEQGDGPMAQVQRVVYVDRMRSVMHSQECSIVSCSRKWSSQP